MEPFADSLAILLLGMDVNAAQSGQQSLMYLM